MTSTRTVLFFAAAALVLAAAALLVQTSPAASAARSSVAVGRSDFGPILFDGRGYALYAFTRDSAGRATCYGACAKAWPPYVVASRPSAGKGAQARLVGATKRRNGKLQATYGGRPLYYYVGDSKPGAVLCQNVEEFGGLWLVVRGSGKLVRSS